MTSVSTPVGRAGAICSSMRTGASRFSFIVCRPVVLCLTGRLAATDVPANPDLSAWLRILGALPQGQPDGDYLRLARPDIHHLDPTLPDTLLAAWQAIDALVTPLLDEPLAVPGKLAGRFRSTVLALRCACRGDQSGRPSPAVAAPLYRCAAQSLYRSAVCELSAPIWPSWCHRIRLRLIHGAGSGYCSRKGTRCSITVWRWITISFAASLARRVAITPSAGLNATARRL